MIFQLPADIQWHFIGHLQSNKAKALLGIFLNILIKKFLVFLLIGLKKGFRYFLVLLENFQFLNQKIQLLVFAAYDFMDWVFVILFIYHLLVLCSHKEIEFFAAGVPNLYMVQTVDDVKVFFSDLSSNLGKSTF